MKTKQFKEQKKHSEYFITHCCRRKSRKKGLLPARQRYLAGYVNEVLKLSKSQGLGFLILSGKFGFLKENAKIPYYDKLLTYPDFDSLNRVVDKQYKKYKFKKAVFFHVDPVRGKPPQDGCSRAVGRATSNGVDTKIDGKVRTYVDFMKEFSARNKITTTFVPLKERMLSAFKESL